VFDLADDHLCNLDMRDKGYDFCGYQHFTGVIGADGHVYPCCTLKYNAATTFGDIKLQSFKDIWMGEKRKKWLKIDHLKLVCDKQPCWMDKKNLMISYLIKNNPPHVNYI
jgi:radical SAM protein with 4Fe4S-binding SPASM domain